MAGMKRIGTVVDGSNEPKVSGKLVRQRKRRFHERIPNWIIDYAVELGIGAAILIAVFLLLEPWNLRECLISLIKLLIGKITMSLNSFIANFINRLSLSDAIGILILLGVTIVIIFRIRWRILNNDHFWSDHCPRCDSSGLKRVRRYWFDRLIGVFGIPVRRYRCSDCKWRGLRVYVHTGRRRLKVQYPQIDPPGDNSLFS
jgi:hypothetical protein